jgi:hypothetical protein
VSKFKTVLEPAEVRSPAALPFPNASKCEFTLNIGLFFDGTDNNRRVEREKKNPHLNTNIVRLWDAYRDDRRGGYFRYYVSGVGTPFTEIERDEAETFGATGGGGGEARIVYGLLEVINSVHRFVNDQDVRFDVDQLAALCSTTQLPRENHDLANRQYRLTAKQKILEDLGLSRGLVGAEDRIFIGHRLEGERRQFFDTTRKQLAQQIAARESRPKIAAIYIDVFGFSRGAAQARVFVSWLHDLLLDKGKLFGVPSYVRMLGLFDTVASVGLTNAVGNSGHNAWAQARDLLIHPEVRNCVHHVALHELRTNFPVDSVAIGDTLPENCHEHHCPGVHSNVGGGYAPGEQGKGVRLVAKDPREPSILDPVTDSQRSLSFVCLNQMYEAAVKGCKGHPHVPWIALQSKEGDEANLTERFGLQGLPSITKAVGEYFQASAVPTGLNTRDALRRHGLRYLAWRYQLTLVKDGFDNLPSVKYSRHLDEKGHPHYRQGQLIFMRQVKLLESPQSNHGWDPMDNRGFQNGFTPSASAIYQQMKCTAISSTLGSFFDAWVHDSYAGFIAKFHGGVLSWVTTVANMTHAVAESQGYVRWRELYGGSGQGLNTMAGTSAQNRAVA